MCEFIRLFNLPTIALFHTCALLGVFNLLGIALFLLFLTWGCSTYYTLFKGYCSYQDTKLYATNLRMREISCRAKVFASNISDCLSRSCFSFSLCRT